MKLLTNEEKWIKGKCCRMLSAKPANDEEWLNVVVDCVYERNKNDVKYFSQAELRQTMAHYLSYSWAFGYNDEILYAPRLNKQQIMNRAEIKLLDVSEIKEEIF